MADLSQDQLRRWIQDVADTSSPIELGEIVDVLARSANSAVPGVDKPPFAPAPPEEEHMSPSRNYLVAAVVAAVIAAGLIIAIVLVASAGNNGTSDDASAQEGESDLVASEATTADLATEYWQALAAGDRQAALALVDPAELDSQALSPFGRAHTLEGQFDWYASVGWMWQLDECVNSGEGEADCTVFASNPWSEALGVDPVPGNFTVRASENGVVLTRDKANRFSALWARNVFEVFAEWVDENQPDDARIMFDFGTDVNPEILELYEVNTARFVEAHQES